MKFSGKFICPCGLIITSDVGDIFRVSIAEHRVKCKLPIKKVSLPMKTELPELPTCRVWGLF